MIGYKKEITEAKKKAETVIGMLPPNAQREVESYLHLLLCAIAESQIIHYSRIRDLPKAEQKPFRKWLDGQTCPLLKGVAYKDQDAYYDCDYRSWKSQKKRGVKRPVCYD